MNWPVAFKESILQLLGKEEAGYFFESLEKPPVTSVHLNPLKHSSAFSDERRVPWNPHGRYLQNRPSFILDPLYHAGAYYVQESSSQYLASLLKEVMPDKANPLVLDLCAAPGGKTMHLLDALNGKGTVVANEIIKSRLQVLMENLMRRGHSNLIITHNDSKDFARLGPVFDLILVDAPCSGEGLFRRDPTAANHWSEDNVNLCVGRQQRILAEIVQALKPGGVLIFSTCTFNTRENEENVAWLEQTFHLTTLEIDGKKGKRFLPHQTEGEGLFMAALRKTGDAAAIGSTQKRNKTNLPLVPLKKQGPMMKWIHTPQPYEILDFGGVYYAVPEQVIHALEQLYTKLKVIKSGIKMGTLDKHQEIIPEHDLALNLLLSEEIPRLPLNLDEARLYLKKQVPQINIDSKGWHLITYANLGLGFAKLMPGRMNNYLPSELRIIKEITE